MVLAGVGIVMLAVVLWWCRRRSARTGGVDADRRPLVVAELRRRPVVRSLLMVGVAALVVAPALVPLSPAVWLLLFLGLCVAVPVAWRHPTATSPPRPHPAATGDDEPTLELDVGLLGLRRRLRGRSTAFLAVVGPLLAVAAVTVVLVVAGHGHTSPRPRAAAAPARKSTGPTTATTAPPATVPTPGPPSVTSGDAPAVTPAPTSQSPTPSPVPPPPPDPLTALLETLP